MKNITEHWKTSLAGLLVALFTVLLVMKQITVKDWETCIGAIGTILLLFAKDPDKR